MIESVAVMQPESYQYLPVEQLKPGKYQPRKSFPEEGIETLAESIRLNGVLEPILIRPLPISQQYEIVAGERRWRGAQLARLATVPCIIRNYTDEQASQIAIIENTVREGLNPIDEAQAIKNMQEEFGYKQEEIGVILGRSRPAITNLVRLLELDSRVQKLLSEGQLTEVHGRLLAGVALVKQYSLALECVNNDWSTRKLEKEIKQSKPTQQVSTKDFHISKIERQLSDRLGHPVSLLVKKSKSGAVSIFFHNYDSLDSILTKLGYDKDTD